MIRANATRKITSIVICLQFIAGSMPMQSYAATRQDHLRPQAALDGGQDNFTPIVQDLEVKKDGGTDFNIFTLANDVSLLAGAMTGGTNVEHAILEGSDGAIINHSEARGRLEITVTALIEKVLLAQKKGPEFAGPAEKDFRAGLKAVTNLPDAEIETAYQMALIRVTHSDAVFVESAARSIVNKVMNLQLKALIAKGPFKQTVLCVGETMTQYQAGRTEAVVGEDLSQILEGISPEAAKSINLRVAYEPRWMIGFKQENYPDIKTITAGQANRVHMVIKGLYNQFGFEVDYGGSFNKKNAREFASMPEIDGALIGTAGKDPEEVSIIIDAANEVFARDHRHFNVGINFKAENKTTGLKDLAAFVAMLKTKDLRNVPFVIGTPIVKTVREEMDKVQFYLSRTQALGMQESETVQLGEGYSYTKLTGDTKEVSQLFDGFLNHGFYAYLKNGAAIFAVAWLSPSGIMYTQPVVDLRKDLTDEQRKAYYADLLLCGAQFAKSANQSVELWEGKLRRMQDFLSAGSSGKETEFTIGTIKGSKIKEGTYFSMKFKPIAASSDASYATARFYDGFPINIDAPGVAKTTLADGGSAPVAMPRTKDLGAQELKGVRVLHSVDVNIVDANGQIKSLKRLKEEYTTIVDLLDKGATLVLVSHNDKPNGKVVPAWSLKPVADALQKMLDDDKKPYKSIFHDKSITETGLKPGLSSDIVEGAANWLENTRFFKGEQDNYESFRKELAAIVDFEYFGSDAFGAYERDDVSRAGAARYLQAYFEGQLMEKEYKYLLEALTMLHGLVIGGGPKFQEKLDVVKNVAKNMKEGTFIAWGSAPMGTILKVEYNLDVGAGTNAENRNNYTEVNKIAKEKGIELIEAVDFVACDKNPAAIAEGDKTWIDLKKVPEGARVMNVKLVIEENDGVKTAKLIDKVTGETLDPAKTFLCDIGEETRALFAKKIKETPQGKAVVHNGTVGIFEIPLFAAGGKAVDVALAEATHPKDAQGKEIEGILSIIAGGDTVKEVEKNKLDMLMTHCATGGGSSLALLQGKILKVAESLGKLQVVLQDKLAKLFTDQASFMRFIARNKQSFTATGGQPFRQMVEKIEFAPHISGLVNQVSLKGEVVAGEQENTATVRETLVLGSFKTEGNAVLTGSSADVARFFPIVEKIIRDSNLDLYKYDDLQQALKMIRAVEIGEKKEKIPASVVEAVSSVLSQMSAQLNARELKEYLAWNTNKPLAEGHQLKGGAVLVPVGFFKTPGATTALNIAGRLNQQVKIAVYGEKADSLKLLIKSTDSIAAATIEEAVAFLQNMGISPNRIIQIQNLTNGNGDVETRKVLQANNIKQLVSDSPATVTVAKAVEEAIGSTESKGAFDKFYASLKDTGVISQGTYDRTVNDVTAALNAQATTLPSISLEMSLDETKSKEYSDAKTEIAAFINKA